MAIYTIMQLEFALQAVTIPVLQRMVIGLWVRT